MCRPERIHSLINLILPCLLLVMLRSAKGSPKSTRRNESNLCRTKDRLHKQEHVVALSSALIVQFGGRHERRGGRKGAMCIMLTRKDITYQHVMDLLCQRSKNIRAVCCCSASESVCPTGNGLIIMRMMLTLLWLSW